MISQIGINIKKYRDLRNISIGQLCNIAEVTESTISQIETGKRESLRSDIIKKIANALNVDINI